MYITTGRSGTSSMTFTYGNTLAVTRTFDIKVTYYTCTSPNLYV